METETKTETTPELDAIKGTRHPLAKVVPIDESRVDLFNPRKWTREDIEVIKKTVCPAGIPDADFKLFIMKCQASGMNPLLGEAFCIKRNQNIGSKDVPKWVEVFQFTPGEQGMEGRADDFPDYRGLRAAAVYENDKIIIDSSAGEVSHQWNPVDPKRGRLVGAWAIAYRDGRKTPVEYVRLDEYFDARNPKWNSSPATMLVKCARAAALRRAYPNTFDGIFAREELTDDGERTSEQQAQVEQANRPTTDILADRLKATAKAQGDLKPSAKGSTVDVVASKPPEKVEAPTTVVGYAELKQDLARYEILYDIGRLETDKAYAAEKANEVKARREKAAEVAKAAGNVTSAEGRAVERAQPPVEEGPLMIFGAHKKKPIRSLSGPDLLTELALGESKLAAGLTTDEKSTAEQKAAKVRACIEDIKREMARREAALLDDAPEPGGSDFEVL